MIGVRGFARLLMLIGLAFICSDLWRLAHGAEAPRVVTVQNLATGELSCGSLVKYVMPGGNFGALLQLESVGTSGCPTPEQIIPVAPSYACPNTPGVVCRYLVWGVSQVNQTLAANEAHVWQFTHDNARHRVSWNATHDVSVVLSPSPTATTATSLCYKTSQAGALLIGSSNAPRAFECQAVQGGGGYYVIVRRGGGVDQGASVGYDLLPQ